jgi:hypothetical protein
VNLSGSYFACYQIGMIYFAVDDNIGFMITVENDRAGVFPVAVAVAAVGCKGSSTAFYVAFISKIYCQIFQNIIAIVNNWFCSFIVEILINRGSQLAIYKQQCV